ncbi:hypothetical protein V1264_017712 [Littorina saxatilis]
MAMLHAAAFLCLLVSVRGDLLHSAGFESLAHWDCWSPVHCELTTTAHSGHHAVKVTGRQENWQGPSQYVSVQPGHQYHVTGYVKLLNDNGHAQSVKMTLDYHFADDTEDYATAASVSNVHVRDGWVHLTGGFTAPSKALKQTRIYFEGPQPSVTFLVDDASVTQVGGQTSWRNVTDHVIEQMRKSNIHIHVTRSQDVEQADVQIHVVQKKKSFPFGTALNVHKYNDNVANGKYRDFIHNHFNWAVPGNALKWYAIESHQGQRNFQPALDMIHRLHSRGLKVRGHNLIWSVEKYVQGWVKQLTGDTLRHAVQHHIQETMNVTRGMLEHWDVNNENLHGHWFEERLHDNNYNIEVFRIAHNADPTMKLFLNEYNVVANGEKTNAYLAQAKQVKAANVGLYGIGVQCHFGEEQNPDPDTIKARLDTLAAAGLPIWVTELDVIAQDENKRADFLEHALRALYGHPAVEGILLWGFWDQAHWRGEKASLVKGDNLELTAAGRRFLDLVENQWMTDETHVLSQSRDTFTVRGFHGDYELHVIYKGHDLTNLKKTFTLGKENLIVKLTVDV